jgi:hypothetical protein
LDVLPPALVVAATPPAVGALVATVPLIVAATFGD